jgi:hypothetical protein
MYVKKQNMERYGSGEELKRRLGTVAKYEITGKCEDCGGDENNGICINTYCKAHKVAVVFLTQYRRQYGYGYTDVEIANILGGKSRAISRVRRIALNKIRSSMAIKNHMEL